MGLRSLVIRLIALGAVAALVGCGGGSGGSAAGGSAPLVLARGADAVSLDPSQASDGMSLNVTQEVMKGLVEFKAGGFHVEPAIAARWHVSADGHTWTFTLKPGLKFSDGTPLDAQAVRFNFNRWRLVSDPYHANFSYPYYASMFGGFPGLITDVRAPNPTTVIFTLARPFSPFLHDLAMPSFAIGSPRAIRDDLAGFAQHPVGWGPYTLAQWVRNDHITLQANPLYPIHPAYKRVVIRDIPDRAKSLQAIQSGEASILTNLRASDAALLAKQPNLRIYYQPANNTSYLAMNMDRAPFQKLDVRRAFAYGIDVASIVKRLYPRGALVANNWTPPGMLGENPAVKAYPYDPSRARALLASAGFPHGFTTQLLYSKLARPYMPQPQLVAEAIAADLQRIGVSVTLEPLAWGVFLEKIHNGEHAMCLTGWSGDNGDPDNFMYTLLDRDSARRPNAQNYSFWRNPTFHALMIAGQYTSDTQKRAAIYREANALIHARVPAIPIVHVTVPIALNAAVLGYIPSPDTHINFESLYPAGSAPSVSASPR